MTSAEIRKQFIDFFVQRHGHTFVPSSSVVPHDDPTLLFTNAGMNQFKPIFLGQETRPYTRAANTQKCIRAGGKHNDLDDVGRSRRHGTFFEMLGNWSFGDYFKRGAIEMAWELLTQLWKMDPSRLHVSCFEGDEKNGVPRDTEAAQLWKEIAGLPVDHIHFFGKDNFWEMGDTGPCGPCSEIHIDRTPDKSGGRDVNGDDPRVMEFWNLVFIQYNRNPDRSLTPLPAQHVDTGMGFERICSILQGKDNMYAIDLFDPLFAAIGKLCGRTYQGTFSGSDTGGASADSDSPQLQTDIAFRAIADHARMATFSVTDGAVPSNKKRGAVLRSVIRRAVRFGYQVLDVKRPFLHTLVPVLVDSMGEAFPELKRDPKKVSTIIREEEDSFLSVIDRGLHIFADAARAAQTRPGKVFLGSDIFNLHATLGFPSDMTIQLARERGLTPDEPGYEKLWDEHIKVSGAGRKVHSQVAVDLSSFAKTDDSPKYRGFTTEASVIGWVIDDNPFHDGKLDEDAQAALLLDRTSFYAEQGGQVGDVGTIQTATGRFDVSATERKGDWVLHWGVVSEGRIEAHQRAAVTVDIRRADTMRNHTTTHLLNWALRKVLGDHVEQKGSLVDAEHLRFDFTHPQSVTHEQLASVERMVNEKIYSDLPVKAEVMPLAEAKKLAGVRAVFGEKYPDPVRVIAIGVDDPKHASAEHSIEFCGGTHLTHTGEAGFFKITAEESVSKGVRRITAVTGRGAVEYVQSLELGMRQISHAMSAPIDEVPRRVASLQEEIRQLKKKLASGAGGSFDAKQVADDIVTKLAGDEKFIAIEVKAMQADQLLSVIDSVKKRVGTFGVLLGAVIDEKASFVAAVSDDLIGKGLKAGDWVREAAKVAGGSGGGRPQLAQAGGKDPSKLSDALTVARTFAKNAVK